MRLGRRFATALMILAGVFLAGVLGFIALGYRPVDAVYETAVVIGQVGYGSGPESAAGRLFVVVLIFAGVAAIAYALASFIDLLVQGDLKGQWERRRMEKRLSGLSGHTIITGLGRVGSVVAETLSADKAPFVIVDQCDDCIERARDEGWLFVQGDATDEETLEHAGIRTAGSLVSTLDSDAENLFVTVTARALNPAIFVVARSTHVTSEEKLRRGGADRVITPNVIGGRRMAAMVLHPVVADYLDLVAHGEGVEFRLQEVELPAGSQFNGKSIAEAAVRERTGAYILAIRRTDGSVDTNPMPEARLESGQRLVVLGTQDQVQEFVTECAVCTSG